MGSTAFGDSCVHTAESITRVFEIVQQFGDAQRPNQRIWYRGVGRTSYGLVPNILRGRSTLTADAVNNDEARLIALFRQRSLPYWDAGYGQTDWEHLFAMQHHGARTRLLDWSESALVALWFALDGAAAMDDPPALWLLDPQELNRVAAEELQDAEEVNVYVIHSGARSDIEKMIDRYAPGETLVLRKSLPAALYGTFNSARITHQRGGFTVLGRSLDPLEDQLRVIQCEHPVLWKVVLEGPAIEHLERLKQLGASATQVYPDLNGLAQEINEIVLGIS